jgi:hypothetical protein
MLNGLTVLSLAAFIGLTVMFIRGFWSRDVFELDAWSPRRISTSVRLDWGMGHVMLTVDRIHYDPSTHFAFHWNPGQRYWSFGRLSDRIDYIQLPGLWYFRLFRDARVINTGKLSTFGIAIPDVLLIILAGVVPAVWLVARKRRQIAGHCVKCGYNLTGNISGVCPECGKPITPKA